MKLLSIIKVVFITFLFSAVFLFILAFALYKFGLSADKLKLGIMLIYGLSGFIGGFIAGKTVESKKFLWGIVIGLAYFAVIFVISVVANKGLSLNYENVLIQLALCSGTGMLGGMLA